MTGHHLNHIPLSHTDYADWRRIDPDSLTERWLAGEPERNFHRAQINAAIDRGMARLNEQQRARWAREENTSC